MSFIECGRRLSLALWRYPSSLANRNCRDTSNGRDSCKNRFNIWTGDRHTQKAEPADSPSHPRQVPAGTGPLHALRTERKHFVDTIKMMGYRAETSLASLLREHLARSDDARVLLRQIFQNEVDLLPDSLTHSLTVGLHHFTQAAHDQAIAQLLRI